MQEDQIWARQPPWLQLARGGGHHLLLVWGAGGPGAGGGGGEVCAGMEVWHRAYV